MQKSEKIMNNNVKIDKNINKTPVYFMPGLAASPAIFERIELSDSIFEMYYLEWIMPKDNESLREYAQRMVANVKHENAVLIGVSFGGILVQEMEVFLKPRKVIIISSIKSNKELPNRLLFAKKTKAYKLVPTSLLQDVEKLAKYSFGNYIKERLKLYEKYLHVRDQKYLNWAIEQVVCWDRNQPKPNVIHIHGDADEVFPAKNITNFTPIKGGTHLMILNRYKWFNEHLPKIILDE